MELTVIICTYNPRPGTIAQTLAALRAQTLPPTQWELVIIDNASTNGVPAGLDLGWHPHARRLVEPTKGIAAARHRAYAEVLGGESQVLLFVDDDTLLDPDYLATGLAFAAQDPRLGCWGGQLLPRYELDPPEWFPPFRKYLAIFPLDRDLVADTFNGNHDYLPPTAGMFLRRQLIAHYFALNTTDPVRLSFGSKGNFLLRGEDTDLALSSYDCGLRTGRFQALRLTHLISKDRVTLDYVERVLEGVRTNMLLIDHLRGRSLPPQPGIFQRLRQRWQVKRLPERQGRFLAAELRGERKAREIIAAAAAVPPSPRAP